MVLCACLLILHLSSLMKGPSLYHLSLEIFGYVYSTQLLAKWAIVLIHKVVSLLGPINLDSEYKSASIQHATEDSMQERKIVLRFSCSSLARHVFLVKKIKKKELVFLDWDDLNFLNAAFTSPVETKICERAEFSHCKDKSLYSSSYHPPLDFHEKKIIYVKVINNIHRVRPTVHGYA